VNDARAVPALLSLATTPGRYTAAYALKGLAGHKTASARTLFQVCTPISLILQSWFVGFAPNF